MNFARHVERIKTRNVCGVLDAAPEEHGPLGKPTLRQNTNITAVWVDWSHVTEGRQIGGPLSLLS
jgi:hypothetical protein